MKKHIAIATGLLLVSSSAFATKARMAALGQDENYGSHYLKDSRNVFRNAANVNGMKNYVVTEWGNAAATESSAIAPSAEGGFFREAGNFAYGVYLGSDLDSQNATRAGGNGYGGSAITQGVAGFLDRDNEIDLFFAGDMGVEWGVRVGYSASKSEPTGSTKQEHSGMDLGLGIVMGDLEASANLNLKDESTYDGTNAGSKWEGGGMNLDVSYAMGSNTFYASYATIDSEFTSGTGVAKNETERKTLELGVGHVKEVSSTSRMIGNISYRSVEGEDKDGTTATSNQTQKDTSIPLTVGFETDATSWLTLRGAVSQNVLINNRETKVGASTTKATRANDTGVVAGATLNFGKLKVDGMIGNNGVNGQHTNASGGVLDTDRLLTRVGVHYWF